MNSKVILRLLVTLAILAGLGVGAYFIWFAPTNELEAFNNLTYVYEQENGLQDFKVATAELKNANALQLYNNEGEVVGSVTYTTNPTGTNVNEHNKEAIKQIAYLREYMYGTNYSLYDNVPNKISTTKLSYESHYGFEEMFNYVDGVFNYYYSYSQLAEDVGRDDLEKINADIVDLENKLEAFNNEMYSLHQTQILFKSFSDASVVNEIKTVYENVFNKYFDVIKSYIALTDSLQSFVNQYVFNNTFVYDNNTVFNAIAIEMLQNVKNTTIDISADKITNNVIDAEANSNTAYIIASYDIAVLNELFDPSSFSIAFPSVKYKEVVAAYEVLALNEAKAIEGSVSIFKLSREKLVEFNSAVIDDSYVPTGALTEYNKNYLKEIQTLIQFLYWAD